jgi:hypothetical protein
MAVKRRKSVVSVVGGILLGSVVFYLVTNFADFYPPVMYPHTSGGVLNSYYNALPFFRNTLFGDLFYVGLLFGSYELVSQLVKHRTKTVRPVGAA